MLCIGNLSLAVQSMVRQNINVDATRVQHLPESSPFRSSSMSKGASTGMLLPQVMIEIRRFNHLNTRSLLLLANSSSAR
jgi:hypothetical protein